MIETCRTYMYLLICEITSCITYHKPNLKRSIWYDQEFAQRSEFRCILHKKGIGNKESFYSYTEILCHIDCLL